MREGININSGLFALGKVISRLIDKKGHVPFRDSKITRLLQDSLGGNSQTLMIACISPAESNMTESLSTLRYACRARHIKNKPVVNRDQTSARISQMQEYIKSLEEALRSKGGNPVGDQLYNGEEFQQLQREREFLDGEVQRLMTKNKELMQEMNTVSEELHQKELERDCALLQVQRIVEKAGISPEMLDEVKVSESDLNYLNDQRESVSTLKNALATAQLEISTLKTRLTSYEQSPLKVKRPRKSLPPLYEIFPLKADQNAQEVKFELEKLQLEKSASGDGDSHLLEMEDSRDVLQFTLEEDEQSLTGKLEKERESREQDFELYQGQLHSNLRNLDLEMRSKQELIAALIKAQDDAEQMRRKYERKIREMETEIVSVAEQRDQTLNRIEASRTDDVQHLEQDRIRFEKRLRTLKEQLASYREKLKESEIRARIQKREETQLRNLQMEVSNMRNQRVRLEKRIKEESDKHREWRMEWERQMKLAAKKERQFEIEMQKMKSRAAQAEVVMRRKNEENANLMQRLRAAQPSHKKQEVIASHFNTKKLMKAISTEVEKITRLWYLCEELDAACDERETLVQDLESLRLRTSSLGKKSDESEFLSDQIEDMQDQLVHVNSKITEVEAQLQELGAPIPKSLDAPNFKTDRKFFLQHPIQSLEEAKEVILYLINKLIPAVKVRDSLKEKNLNMGREILQLQKDLKSKEASLSLMEATFRRNAIKRETEIVHAENNNFKEMLNPECEDITQEFSNYDDAKDEKHYVQYTETWKNKIAARSARKTGFAHYTTTWKNKLNSESKVKKAPPSPDEDTSSFRYKFSSLLTKRAAKPTSSSKRHGSESPHDTRELSRSYRIRVPNYKENQEHEFSFLSDAPPRKTEVNL
eukprot:TRINITY_DN34454_c0_g2_i1.p1 TRINITY_DN34454_c0_g2~~TRINITY_DN34454_c0_g2_i1.p1  ORF type:complete len:918 (+),score=261.38 TRINITY_DN34454_c0_g2_i1:125-2755(+)